MVERGRQVFRVISITEPDPSSAAQLPPARTRAQASSVGVFEIVIVKWFNRARGFGFLTRGEGTEDIFVDMETLRRYGFIDPKPGDTMLARFGPGPKGLMAAEVRPLDGSKISAALSAAPPLRFSTIVSSRPARLKRLTRRSPCS